jgi:shikimate kinase
LAQEPNIILVGFMASGKSRVGRILAEKLGRTLVDADQEIVRRRGMPVSQIFAQEGESAFRALERTVIADLCGQSGLIIAAGGGAFVDPESRRLMLQKGRVFCLCASPETIYDRVHQEMKSGGPARPLLAGADPQRRIRELLEQRAEAYAQAHHAVQTDGLTPEQVARRVQELLVADAQS